MIGSSARTSSVGRRPVDPPGDRGRLEERQQPVDEVVVVEPADPLAVQPLEPLAVEGGAALLDLLEVEALDELVEREDLLLGARSTSRAARGS